MASVSPGARARTRTDRRPDVDTARRELDTAMLAEHIARVVADAPPLTPEQTDRLCALLRPAATGRRSS